MRPDPLRHLTPETYLQFVDGLLRLKTWYAWHLVNRVGTPVDEVLERRIYLFRFAYPVSEADWIAWKGACRELLAVYGNACSCEPVESWVSRTDGVVAVANLATHFEREYAKPIRDSWAGFTYEFRPDYRSIGKGDPDLLTLHFRNAFVPDSPFAHLEELRQGLREILEKARRERPDVTGMQCATWLVSLESFASLFPPSWGPRAVPCAPGNHMGWWGQFMDRRGRFHAANGTYLRRTGQFPHQHRHMTGPLRELREILGIGERVR